MGGDFMFIEGINPLRENYRLINKMQAVWDNIFSHKKEAEELRKTEFQKYLASIQEGKVDEATKRYAGTIVNQKIDLMLYTQTVLPGLFEIIPFTNGNIPTYSTGIVPEIEITRMSSHGQPPSVVKYMSETQYFPSLYRISTPKVYQYAPSILTGETGPDERVWQRMEYEIAMAIEDDMWDLLTAALGSLSSSSWVYDSRIQNVPTTNTHDFSSEGGLTVGLFRKILQVVDSIPSRTRPGESARIRNIFIPHTAAADIREWVSVVSNISGGAAGSSNDNQTVVSAELARQIEMNGPMISTMWGENIGLRKVNRLMGTSAADFDNYLWVFLDGPVGRFYTVPDLDRVTTLTDREPDAYGMVITRTIGMEIPDFCKPNFFRVKFAS